MSISGAGKTSRTTFGQALLTRRTRSMTDVDPAPADRVADLHGQLEDVPLQIAQIHHEAAILALRGQPGEARAILLREG